MPFGLINAPASFSRVMRTVLRGMKHVNNFIDDILIRTETWDKHLEVLEEVLEIMHAKEEDGVDEVLVHYTGWPRKYNEWRPASDVEDVPEEHTFTCPAATRYFYSQ